MRQSRSSVTLISSRKSASSSGVRRGSSRSWRRWNSRRCCSSVVARFASVGWAVRTGSTMIALSPTAISSALRPALVRSFCRFAPHKTGFGRRVRRSSPGRGEPGRKRFPRLNSAIGRRWRTPAPTGPGKGSDAAGSSLAGTWCAFRREAVHGTKRARCCSPKLTSTSRRQSMRKARSSSILARPDSSSSAGATLMVSKILLRQSRYRTPERQDSSPSVPARIYKGETGSPCKWFLPSAADDSRKRIKPSARICHSLPRNGGGDPALQGCRCQVKGPNHG